MENDMNGHDHPMNEGFIRRFERSQEEQEKNISKLGQEVYSVKSQADFIQRDIAKINTLIETLSAKLEERGRTNWPAVSAFLALIPMMAVILAMYVGYSVSPMAGRISVLEANTAHLTNDYANIERLQQASAAADVNSSTDRTQLNEKVRLLQEGLASEIAQRRESASAFRVSLAEIETQFCASDSTRNLMHANDLRNIAVLWEKEFDRPYPITNAYYPTICKGRDNGTN